MTPAPRTYWSSTLNDDPAAGPPASTGPARTEHYDVVIIGGGNAGISLAARLRRYGIRDVVIVEPSERHLYQPLFSHIGGGTARAEEAYRPQADVMPKGVRWIRDAAVDITPGREDGPARLRYGAGLPAPGDLSRDAPGLGRRTGAGRGDGHPQRLLQLRL